MATPNRQCFSYDTGKQMPVQPSTIGLSDHVDPEKNHLPSTPSHSENMASASYANIGQSYPELPNRYRWRPAFFRIRPMVGLAAIVAAIACLFVSFSILVTSNGQTSASWSFQPTVYLAIATAISNTALNGALAQAAPISWWYKAQSGSTIRDLELQWQAGQSFPRAIIRSLRQGRHLGLLTVAGIFVSMVVVDGPLLQRASSVQLATLTQPVTMDIELSPELPHGFSGTTYPNDVLSVNHALDLVFNQYTRSASSEVSGNKAGQIPMIISAYCSGECKAKVRAPGIARTGCVNKTWSITEKMLHDPSSTWGSRNYIAPKPVFYSNIEMFGDDKASGPMRTPGREAALLTTGITNFESCSGQYVETNCTISSAVLEYDVIIRGHEISIANSVTSGRVLAEANNTFYNISLKAPQQVTLMALIEFLEPLLEANASLAFPFPKGKLDYVDYNSLNLFATQHFETSLMHGPCDLRFSDPTNDIVSTFNSIMFRAGVLTGTWRNTTHLIDEGLSVNQTIQAQLMEKQTVFHSDLKWFAGAATIQGITIILILPVFWGWWTIGVDMTLSPFQAAKMLDAPLLKDVNSAAGATGISNDIGDQMVKLGLVEVYQTVIPANTDGKLASGVTVLSGSRIGIAEPQAVVRPHKGMRFTH